MDSQRYNIILFLLDQTVYGQSEGIMNCKSHPWAVHGGMDTAWFVKVFRYDHELDKPVRGTTGRTSMCD